MQNTNELGDTWANSPANAKRFVTCARVLQQRNSDSALRTWAAEGAHPHLKNLIDGASTPQVLHRRLASMPSYSKASRRLQELDPCQYASAKQWGIVALVPSDRMMQTTEFLHTLTAAMSLLALHHERTRLDLLLPPPARAAAALQMANGTTVLIAPDGTVTGLPMNCRLYAPLDHVQCGHIQAMGLCMHDEGTD